MGDKRNNWITRPISSLRQIVCGKKPMKTIYINYFDEITPTKTRAFMNTCSQLLGTTPTPDKFYFLFASSGGNVESGIALYNFLRALPVKLAFHNIGAVDPIGTIVFLAGKNDLLQNTQLS